MREMWIQIFCNHLLYIINISYQQGIWYFHIKKIIFHLNKLRVFFLNLRSKTFLLLTILVDHLLNIGYLSVPSQTEKMNMFMLSLKTQDYYEYLLTYCNLEIIKVFESISLY